MCRATSRRTHWLSSEHFSRRLAEYGSQLLQGFGHASSLDFWPSSDQFCYRGVPRSDGRGTCSDPNTLTPVGAARSISKSRNRQCCGLAQGPQSTTSA